MSQFRFDLKAKVFRAEKELVLLRMANFAVHQSKIIAFDKSAWDGKKWAPKKVRDGRKLLVKTGTMRASIQIMRRGPSSITYGTDVAYAKYHNEGTTRMPKRQFIGMNRAMKAFNQKVIKEYLKRTSQRGKIHLR